MENVPPVIAGREGGVDPLLYFDLVSGFPDAFMHLQEIPERILLIISFITKFVFLINCFML